LDIAKKRRKKQAEEKERYAHSIKAFASAQQHYFQKYLTAQFYQG
jgi:hypothetical protein